jgi:hypothetical protein
VRLLARPTNAAQAIFALACHDAAELSFAVGAEHLLLAAVELDEALLEPFGVTPDDIRERIVADERDALASLGISLDSVLGELEERFGTRPDCLPITPEAKRTLELAARRRRLVTPAQMAVALVDHSPTARRLLAELGVPCQTLKRMLSTSPSSTT